MRKKHKKGGSWKLSMTGKASRTKKVHFSAAKHLEKETNARRKRKGQVTDCARIAHLRRFSPGRQTAEGRARGACRPAPRRERKKTGIIRTQKKERPPVEIPRVLTALRAPRSHKVFGFARGVAGLGAIRFVAELAVLEDGAHFNLAAPAAFQSTGTRAVCVFGNRCSHIAFLPMDSIQENLPYFSKSTKRKSNPSHRGQESSVHCKSK